MLSIMGRNDFMHVLNYSNHNPILLEIWDNCPNFHKPHPFHHISIFISVSFPLLPSKHDLRPFATWFNDSLCNDEVKQHEILRWLAYNLTKKLKKNPKTTLKIGIRIALTSQWMCERRHNQGIEKRSRIKSHMQIEYRSLN